MILIFVLDRLDLNKQFLFFLIFLYALVYGAAVTVVGARAFITGRGSSHCQHRKVVQCGGLHVRRRIIADGVGAGGKLFLPPHAPQMSVCFRHPLVHGLVGVPHSRHLTNDGGGDGDFPPKGGSADGAVDGYVAAIASSNAEYGNTRRFLVSIDLYYLIPHNHRVSQ